MHKTSNKTTGESRCTGRVNTPVWYDQRTYPWYESKFRKLDQISSVFNTILRHVW